MDTDRPYVMLPKPKLYVPLRERGGRTTGQARPRQQGKTYGDARSRTRGSWQSASGYRKPCIWSLLLIIGLVSAIVFRYSVLQPKHSILDASLLSRIRVSEQDFKRVYDDLSKCPFARQDLLPDHAQGMPGYKRVVQINQVGVGLDRVNMRRLYRGLHAADTRQVLEATGKILAQVRQATTTTKVIDGEVKQWALRMRNSRNRYEGSLDAASRVVSKNLLEGNQGVALTEAMAVRASRDICRPAYDHALAHVTRWESTLSAASKSFDAVVAYFERHRAGVLSENQASALSNWNHSLAHDIWRLIDDEKVSQDVVEEFMVGVGRE